MALIACADCEAKISEKAVACPKCGSKKPNRQLTVVCSECEAKVSVQAQSCPECGNPDIFPPSSAKKGASIDIEEFVDLVRKGETNRVDHMLRLQPSLANISDSSGVSILWSAALSGTASTVKVLLNAGAKPPRSGRSNPIFLAIDQCNNKMVQYLVDAGVSLDIQEVRGQKEWSAPLKYARKVKRKEWLKRSVSFSMTKEEAARKKNESAERLRRLDLIIHIIKLQLDCNYYEHD